jgi:diketogulonate reductase-like aldo/keto reductase
MAYSPLDQGRLLDDPAVQAVSDRYGVSPAQLALAWVLRRDGVIAIPRAGVGSHVNENRAALKIALTDRDVADLDRAFPPPEEPRPLEML